MVGHLSAAHATQHKQQQSPLLPLTWLPTCQWCPPRLMEQLRTRTAMERWARLTPSRQQLLWCPQSAVGEAGRQRCCWPCRSSRRNQACSTYLMSNQHLLPPVLMLLYQHQQLAATAWQSSRSCSLRLPSHSFVLPTAKLPHAWVLTPHASRTGRWVSMMLQQQQQHPVWRRPLSRLRRAEAGGARPLLLACLHSLKTCQLHVWQMV